MDDSIRAAIRAERRAQGLPERLTGDEVHRVHQALAAPHPLKRATPATDLNPAATAHTD